MDIFNKKKLKESENEIKRLEKAIETHNEETDVIFNNMVQRRVGDKLYIINSQYEEKERLYKQEIKQYRKVIDECQDAFIKLSDNHKELKEKYYKSYKREVITMPDRDGKGPRERSPKPSKKKGGDKKGDC